MSPSGWRELPRRTKSECPKLFYRFSTEDDNLSIKLTDLVAIWESCLDRDTIIAAAKQQHSSIDPSESNSQLRVLLEKLNQSLEAGNNRILRVDDSATQRIHLKTKLELPRPLKALSWTFDLELQDAGELAEQLLRPCLHEASVAKQKLDSLLRVIKDKDHVLSRLLEKVDTSAIDLSLIFPGITGLKLRKGRVSTREAQKHVPGMAEFDYDKWVHGFENDSLYAGFDQTGMNSLVAGCERCPKHTVRQHCDWFKALPMDDGRSTATTPDSKSSTNRKTAQALHEMHSTETESDFERQRTPPHLKPSKAKSKRPAQSDAESSNQSDEEQSRLVKKARLGGLGRSNAQKESPPVSRGPVKASAQRQQTKSADEKSDTADFATDTASEDDSLNSKDSPAPRTQRQTQSTNHKLGKLTGKHKSHSKSRSASPDKQSKRPSSSSDANHPSPSTSKFNRLRKSRSGSKHDPNISENNEIETDIDNNLRQESPVKAKTSSRPQTASDSPSPKANTLSKELPLTPSRRLGRLGKHQSTSESQRESPSHRPKSSAVASRDKTTNPPTHGNNGNRESDSDTATATASDSSSDSNTGKARSKRRGIDKRVKSSKSPRPLVSRHSDSTPVPEPEPESKREETAEEKANRRREELKKKLDAGRGAGGVRKTRKF